MSEPVSASPNKPLPLWLAALPLVVLWLWHPLCLETKHSMSSCSAVWNASSVWVGGATTLEMARSDMAGLAKGFASFHGGLTTPEGQSWSGDEPPVMIFHGAADTSITMDDVATFSKELEAAGNTYSIEVYSGAPHAFTVFGSNRYQERADTASWDAFKTFLEERL